MFCTGTSLTLKVSHSNFPISQKYPTTEPTRLTRSILNHKYKLLSLKPLLEALLLFRRLTPRDMRVAGLWPQTYNKLTRALDTLLKIGNSTALNHPVDNLTLLLNLPIPLSRASWARSPNSILPIISILEEMRLTKAAGILTLISKSG